MTDVLDFQDYCPAARSKLCSDTLERIRRVYGSLDEIRVVLIRDEGSESPLGGVDPGSPKTIFVTGRTSDIVKTIRHEVVHVRQFAEIFGNVPDVERRRRWEQMAREMTQNDWVEWNFKLELEAYQIAQGIDNELKSPIQKRAAEEELKAVAKRAGMSIAEFQKRFIIDSVRGLLRAQYEQHWINRWKSLRGDVELAPPYFPKPKLGK